MNNVSKFNIPTVLVIFGATGDLIKKKIIPALFYLYEQGCLPEKLEVIGYSRRAWTDEDFRAHVTKILRQYHKEAVDQTALERFLTIFSYHQGTFEAATDYSELAKRLGRIDEGWRICSNKLFYFAVPPEFYENIFRHLKSSHLSDPCSPEEGWTRVLVEKPFGDDLPTARRLDAMLGELFKEEQIYRIDHYLAKDMLQNILAFRFANNIFEQTWNKDFIERIDIRLLESIGVEDRGSFYDSVGALRDVGQNHLLQMLALVTMDHPTSFGPEIIRQKRAQILQSVHVLSGSEVKTATVRAQYEGYRNIAGVASDSQTETYFKLVTHLTAPRWASVPVILESGKRLGQALKEIVVTFKHPQPCLCPVAVRSAQADSGSRMSSEHHKNKIVFQLEPNQGIDIHFWAKKPGVGYGANEMEERTLDFLLHKEKPHTQYVEEYAKLMLDAICGDQTLFVSTAEVATMWQIIDPVVGAWQQSPPAGGVPLKIYKPDTDTITKEAVVEHTSRDDTKRTIGIIGLGKMGGNVARRLVEQGWQVVGYNRSSEDTRALEPAGIIGAYSIEELVKSLRGEERRSNLGGLSTSLRTNYPTVIWLMLPAGETVDQVIKELAPLLKGGDTVIDAGNSFYKDSIRRAKELEDKGIHFLDVGFSGGPAGARNGGCLMIGGHRAGYEQLEPLFRDLSVHSPTGEGYQFFEGVGAGHFVKMVHNGIEYGMMQALAEGFAILRQSTYELNLTEVAKIYNRGSVIESRLTDWLQKAFELHGFELADVSGTVKHTGEGEWTMKTAKELGLTAKIIEGALEFRVLSEQNPSYTGKILSALREQFGGHSVKN